MDPAKMPGCLPTKTSVRCVPSQDGFRPERSQQWDQCRQVGGPRQCPPSRRTSVWCVPMSTSPWRAQRALIVAAVRMVKVRWEIGGRLSTLTLAILTLHTRMLTSVSWPRRVRVLDFGATGEHGDKASLGKCPWSGNVRGVERRWGDGASASVA